MPIIQITLPTGFTRAEKAALYQGLTEVAQRTVDAPLTNVRILLNEQPLENFAHAGLGLDAQPLPRLAAPVPEQP